MGHRVTRRVGPQGGAPCPGATHPPWTSRPTFLPMPCGNRGRSLRYAPWPVSVVRRATRGALAISPPVHRVWRIARASRAPALIRRLRTSSRPSLRGAVGLHPGAPSNCCRSCTHIIRAGRCPGAPQPATSCAAMAGSLRHAALATSAPRQTDHANRGAQRGVERRFQRPVENR